MTDKKLRIKLSPNIFSPNLNTIKNEKITKNLT